MTQYDLWRISGISAPRISLVERGFARFREQERQAVAAALGVPVDQIDFESDDTPSDQGQLR